MSGKNSELWISLAFLVLVLTVFRTSGAWAAGSTAVKPGVQGNIGVKPGVQGPSSDSEKQNRDVAEWRTGLITLAPHISAKTKQTMIAISNSPYVLSKNLVIVERYEEKPGSGRSERVAGMAALTLGKKVFFELLGTVDKVITKIVIDSMPKRK